MTLSIVIAVSMIVGFAAAEVWHRISLRRMEATRKRDVFLAKRNALLAEYIDKQLWQFISVDEWLGAQGEQQP